MAELTLAHILQCINGELDDTSVLGRIITGVAPSAVAGPQEITFQSNPKYWKDLKQTRAAAVITAERIPDLAIPQILHRNPYAAMAKAALLFYEERHDFAGISPQAYIHPDAHVHESCTVYPFAFIEAGVKVGPRSVIYPYTMLHHGVEVGEETVLYAHVVVMRNCRIGSRCRLFPGVVIGADGFGFAPSAEGMIKIPQVGRAIIEDDVEIQALSAVDRGAFGDTVVGQGTKIDDLVLIAHGARIGKHSMLAGNSQIGGSTEIGDRFILGGQGAVGPSLKIPANVIGGPLVGINSSLDEPGTYMGFPAQTIQEWRRQSIAAKKLPEALTHIRELKKELAELRALIERPFPGAKVDQQATDAERDP